LQALVPVLATARRPFGALVGNVAAWPPVFAGPSLKGRTWRYSCVHRRSIAVRGGSVWFLGCLNSACAA